MVDEYYFWLLDARFFQAVNDTDSPSFTDFRTGRLLRSRSRSSRRSGTTRRSSPACSSGDPRRSCASRGAACTTVSSSSRAARTRASQVMPAARRPTSTFLGRVARLARCFKVDRRSCRPGTTAPTPPASATTSPRTSAVVAAARGGPDAGGEHVPRRPCPRIPYFAYVRSGRAALPEDSLQSRARRCVRPAHAVPVRSGAQVVRARVQPARAGRYVDPLPAAYAIPEGGGEPTGDVVLASTTPQRPLVARPSPARQRACPRTVRRRTPNRASSSATPRAATAPRSPTPSR